MIIKKFLDLLINSGDKELLFEYAPQKNIDNAYHITEIKNVKIDSVDCGGNEHSYQQTVVQLWLSGNEEKKQAMSAAKALKIFDLVDQKKPLDKDTEIFFEYGFGSLATSTYRISGITENEEKITIHMEVPKTVCKPREFVNLTPTLRNQNTSCSPGGGCC